MRWFDDEKEPSPSLKALEETRRLATREGWRYQHVQAIIVSIDQYAEAAKARVWASEGWEIVVTDGEEKTLDRDDYWKQVFK